MELTDQKVIEYLEARELLLEEYANARKRFLAAKEDLNNFNIFVEQIIGVKNFTQFGSEKFKLKYEAKELII